MAGTEPRVHRSGRSMCSGNITPIHGRAHRWDRWTHQNKPERTCMLHRTDRALVACNSQCRRPGTKGSCVKRGTDRRTGPFSAIDTGHRRPADGLPVGPGGTATVGKDQATERRHPRPGRWGARPIPRGQGPRSVIDGDRRYRNTDRRLVSNPFRRLRPASPPARGRLGRQRTQPGSARPPACCPRGRPRRIGSLGCHGLSIDDGASPPRFAGAETSGPSLQRRTGVTASAGGRAPDRRTCAGRGR